jgi:hypothetical protein
MIFLLIRAFSYIIPVCYLALAKAIFYFADWWQILLLVGLLLIVFNFILLKIKNRQKSIAGLMIFAIIFYLAGMAYLLVLENPLIINIFILVWSAVLWFYLEAVFHDFYETSRTHIMNLQNISLYGNILIIFFLTASLISFNIFLNWPKLSILLILGLVYLAIIHFTFTKQKINRDDAWLYAAIIALVLVEFLVVLLFLPASFYVVAIVLSLAYYFLSSIAILSLKKQLTNKVFWYYLVVCSVFGLAVLLTATWV